MSCDKSTILPCSPRMTPPKSLLPATAYLVGGRGKRLPAELAGGLSKSPPRGARNVVTMHVGDLAGFDLTSLMQLVSLVVLPFAHEDLAIVLGAYIVVNDVLPTGLVVASIYGGMVVSDFALYGIGAGARRLPWLRKHAVDDRVHGFGDLLKRNLFALVALCRFVPGFVFVAF